MERFKTLKELQDEFGDKLVVQTSNGYQCHEVGEFTLYPQCLGKRLDEDIKYWNNDWNEPWMLTTDTDVPEKVSFSFKVDKETLELLERLSEARGKDTSGILQDWINLGRAIDENSDKKSKLTLHTGGENFRIPIGHLGSCKGD